MTREEKQKAIDALKISAPIMVMTQEKFNDYIQILNKVMDWLEQEPITKNNLGVDCISRTRAIERLKLNFPISQGADNSRDRHRYMQALADLQAIKELPPVTPQEPKTGHWIDDTKYGGTECSECGKWYPHATIAKSEIKYCSECGAKMVEP